MAELPPALLQNPLLSTWIRFEGSRVIVHTGKVELGQGISTAIAMIAAEELDVELDQVNVLTGRTDSGPNEFITAGSMSIEGSGLAMRHAAAEARGILLHRAAQKFGIDADQLEIKRGIILIQGGNERISYWQLLENEQLDLPATGSHTPKSPGQYRIVGKQAQRIDLPHKVSGGRPFIQDTTDVDHARIVRPPVLSWTLKSINAEGLEPEVDLVVDGNFVGVIATDETLVVSTKLALEKSIIWDRGSTAPVPDDLGAYLRDNADLNLLVEDGTPTDTPIPEMLEAIGKTIEASYSKPYHLHGSIGPSAAIAELQTDGKLVIQSHSQGPSILRQSVAKVLRMDPEKIDVIHRENAGCYGHNGADDAAMDAALLAFHRPGIPILLKWHRHDEHQWEPFSPATVIDMNATVSDGRIQCWNADIFSQSHSGRPSPSDDTSNLIAAWQKSNPLPRPKAAPGRGPHGGIHRNADPYYNIPAKRITKNLVTDQRVRTSSTRSLGAFANVFAIETFMDELAHRTDTDPVLFRERHLSDDRAIAVLKDAAERLNEYQCPSLKNQLTGKGIAFARYKNTKTYAAIGVALAVDEQTFDITLLHAVITADAGLIIDPDGLANQLEGGMIQAASWTLKEAVQFDSDGIPGADWESYPILTFPEIPTVEVNLLDHPSEPSVGAGEATQGPTPAAISNAIFDATSLRIRDIPFTSDRLRSLALN